MQKNQKNLINCFPEKDERSTFRLTLDYLLASIVAYNRSSCPEFLIKKVKNFATLIGKHLCQNLFFNKAAGQPATLLKTRLWQRCFPVNFCEIFKNTFFIEHLWLAVSDTWIFSKILQTVIYNNSYGVCSYKNSKKANEIILKKNNFMSQPIFDCFFFFFFGGWVGLEKILIKL